MGRLMATTANTDEVLHAVGRKETRLAPKMRDDIRAPCAADLTRKTIPLQNSGLSMSRTYSVIRIETHMERHAQPRQHHGPPSWTQQQQRHQNCRVME